MKRTCISKEPIDLLIVCFFVVFVFEILSDLSQLQAVPINHLAEESQTRQPDIHHRTILLFDRAQLVALVNV